MTRLPLTLLLFIGLAPALLAQSLSLTDRAATLLGPTPDLGGMAVGLFDVNGDGLDDLVRTPEADEVIIHYQQTDATTLPLPTSSSFGGSSIWSIVGGNLTGAAGRDILVGHGSRLDLWQVDLNGNYARIATDAGIFVQGLNLVDLTNSGQLDVFACHDVGLSRTYEWTGAGMVQTTGVLDAYSTIPSDNSGNYSSTFVDFDDDGDLDLYLAKCRFGVSNPMDGRRVNQMFRNDGNGVWTDVAEASGLRPLLQSWSAAFADIDNDGDQDAFVLNHDGFSQLLTNDGTGVYTDVTPFQMQTYLAGNNGWQVGFADLNNDGWQELLFSGRRTGLVIYVNQGDGTYGDVPMTFTGTSFAHGDINDDGFLDLLTSDGSLVRGGTQPDQVLVNDGNSNHFLKLRLEGTASNRDAVGARTYIYGDWGIQTREVRAGESYGIQHSFVQHFGLGTVTTVDSVVIRWPSGAVERYFDVAADQTLALMEGAATLPVELTELTATATKDGDRIRWTVALQREVDHYEIQQSSDGHTFTAVGRRTAGSTATQDYHFLVDRPLVTDRYYRLRTVDRDGSDQLSGVRFLAGGSSEALRLYPNPVTKVLTVDLPADAKVSIVDAYGRTVYARELPAGRQRIGVGALPPGVYTLIAGKTARRLVVQ